jgi:adenine-specific DNA methylase
MAKAHTDRETFRDRIIGAKKPKYWIPKKENEFIVGTVKNFRKITSTFGDVEVMDIEEDETKELLAVMCGTVISSEKEKQNIQIGEHVGIKYLGEEANYRNFIVMVDRPRETKNE